MSNAEERYVGLLENSLPSPGHPNREKWRQYALDGPIRLRPHIDGLVALMRIPGRLLDLGCGDGASCVAATRARVPVVMLDVQHEALRRAKARPCGAQVVRGDGSLLPFDDHTFSAALLNDVVEHLADPARTLREVHRVLRPGAAVRVSTVHRFAPRNVFADPHWGLLGVTILPIPMARVYVERIRRRGTSFDVYRLFTRRSLVTLLEANGFTVGRDPQPTVIPRTVVVVDAVRGG